MTKTNEIVLQKTPVFDLVEKTFEGVNFKPVGLNTKDWVMVIVMDYENRALFVKQTRWGLEGETTEFICGMVENGEDPMKAALRELQEETGLEASVATKIAEFNPNPAYFNNKMHVYFVRVINLPETYKKKAGNQNLDADEDCKPFIAELTEDFVMNTLSVHGLSLSALSVLMLKGEWRFRKNETE